MSWIGPTRLLKPLGTISLKWPWTESARARKVHVRAPEREATYGKIYIISKPRMLAFQPNWNRIIWTSVAQVMVN